MKKLLCTTLLVAQSLIFIPTVVSAASLMRWDEVKGFNNEDPDALLGLVATNCKKLSSLKPSVFLGNSEAEPQLKHPAIWRQLCASFQDLDIKNLSPEEKGNAVRSWFMKWFDPYRLSSELRLHYYYEPTFEASTTPMGAYRFPIYRRPAELMVQQSMFSNFGHWIGGNRDGKIKSYYTREEVDKGELNGRNLEIAWLRSPWEVFILQTMGGGRLHLTDGSFWRVEYDGRNGHKHHSPLEYVNKTYSLNLKTEEQLESWVNQNKKSVYDILHSNPDYTFFKQSITPLYIGEQGTYGVNLLPARTVAVDSHHISLGSLLWVEGQMKSDKNKNLTIPWNHLTLAADNNMSLKDSGSVSLYLGWGKAASEISRHSDINPEPAGDLILFAPRRMKHSKK